MAVHGSAPRRRELDDAWLIAMVRAFFGQKRAAWQGSDRHGNQFGWSPASVVGRLKDERVAAGEGGGMREHHYPEHYSADAILVRRSLEGMAEDPYVCGHLHYMVAAPVKVKSREAGYSPAAYWNNLGLFHTWVKARILLLEDKDVRQ